MEELYLERIVSDIWSGYIVATKKGLAFVSHVITNLKDVVEFQMKYYPNSKLISNAPEIIPYREQLYEYLNGTRYEFDFPIDVSGTVFQEQVWQALYEIPYGETASYLDIAKKIGRDHKSSQAVGGAVGSNPLAIVCPCHRIVGTTGKLTGYAGGIDIKVKLLNHEIEHTPKFR